MLAESCIAIAKIMIDLCNDIFVELFFTVFPRFFRSLGTQVPSSGTPILFHPNGGRIFRSLQQGASGAKSTSCRQSCDFRKSWHATCSISSRDEGPPTFELPNSVTKGEAAREPEGEGEAGRGMAQADAGGRAEGGVGGGGGAG